MNTYDKGDQVRLSLVSTVGGVDTDPTTLTLKHKDPSGNITLLTYGVDVGLVKDSTAHYHYDLTLDESGTWHYRWTATGTVIGAEEGSFDVRPSEF